MWYGCRNNGFRLISIHPGVYTAGLANPNSTFFLFQVELKEQLEIINFKGEESGILTVSRYFGGISIDTYFAAMNLKNNEFSFLANEVLLLTHCVSEKKNKAV